MSLGYATGRSLIHTGTMRRWKDLVSYSNAPVPPVTNPTIGFTLMIGGLLAQAIIPLNGGCMCHQVCQATIWNSSAMKILVVDLV